jgi:hypothetical protein
MAEFFVLLGKLDKTWTPKKGDNKGIEQNQTVYYAVTKKPNNYVLSQYQISDELNSDYSLDNVYYKEVANTSTYYGSPEHLLNDYMAIMDDNVDEDINTAYQWAKRLSEQYLTKQQYLDTWLPTLIIKPEPEKKVLDY